MEQRGSIFGSWKLAKSSGTAQENVVMALHYFMDVYQQTEGASDPVLWRAERVSAQSDAEAIREAKMSFRSLVETNPLVTGFSLRRVGFRRAGDHVIHTQNAASAK
jgi:hypothetical protein